MHDRYKRAHGGVLTRTGRTWLMAVYASFIEARGHSQVQEDGGRGEGGAIYPSAGNQVVSGGCAIIHR